MIHHLRSNIGVSKFFLLWVFSVFFGMSSRTGGTSTFQLHLLAVLNDQYYFIFAILPIYLFFCASAMEDDAPILIMRYGTYANYFFSKWKALGFWATALWLGQMAAILLSGLGLPLGVGWNIAEGGLWRDVFVLLKRSFPAPGIAAICCAGQLLLGYWLIGMATLWLGHFFSRASAVKLLMGLYVLSVLWIKLPMMSRPPFLFLTGFHHWILLLHNLTESWRPFLTIAVTAALVAGMVWSVCRAWRKTVSAVHHRRGLSPYYRRVLLSYRNLLLLVGAVLLPTCWAWLKGGIPADSSEWCVRLFVGHGTGYFYPMGLLVLLVQTVLPLWPLGALSTWATMERSTILTVRLKRKTQLLSALLLTTAQWVFLYGILLSAAAVLPPLVLGLPLNLSLAATAVGLKLLDIGVQYLLILFVLCLTKQTVYGFLLVVLAHFLCVLPLPYLPIGLSSFARLNLAQAGGAAAPVQAALLLAAISAVILVWLYRWGIKRLFNH